MILIAPEYLFVVYFSHKMETDTDHVGKRKIEVFDDDDEEYTSLEHRISVIESTLIDVCNAIQPVLPFLRGAKTSPPYKIPKREPEKSLEELKNELDDCVKKIDEHETFLMSAEQDWSVLKVKRGRLHFGKGKPPRHVAAEYHELSEEIKEKELQIQQTRKELGRLYQVQKSIEPRLNSSS